MARTHKIKPPPEKVMRAGDVEIRFNEDGSLDEIVAPGIHIEQMSDDCWWMDIGGVHVNFFTRTGAHILSNCCNHSEHKPMFEAGHFSTFTR